MPHSLDPVLEMLSGYSSPSDLVDSIRAVYARLDVDNNGSLSYMEMREGLSKLIPGLYFSQEDWDGMIDDFCGNGTPAAQEGLGKDVDSHVGYELTEMAFEHIMIDQLRHHLFRKLNLGEGGEGWKQGRARGRGRPVTSARESLPKKISSVSPKRCTAMTA